MYKYMYNMYNHIVIFFINVFIFYDVIVKEDTS